MYLDNISIRVYVLHMKTKLNGCIGLTIFSLIIVTAIVYIYYYQSSTTKERFEGTLMKSFDNLQNKYGMEICSSMMTSNLSVDNDEIMRDTIGGLRFKEWRPGPNEEDQIKTGKTYCYVYDDSDRNIHDPILSTKQCSTDNWTTGGFIERAFKSTATDRAHNITTEKCVFEINPDKLNNSNDMNAFWDDISKAQCDGILLPLRTRIAQQNATIQDFNGKIILETRSNVGLNTNVSDYELKKNTCTSCNENFNNLYTPLEQDINNNLKPAIADGSRMRHQHMKDWSMYTTLLSERLSDYNEWIRKTDEEIKLFRICEPDRAKCFGNVEMLNLALSTLRARWEIAVSNSNIYNSNVIQLTKDIAVEENDFRVCIQNKNIAQSEYDTYLKDFSIHHPLKVTCFEERSEYQRNYAHYKQEGDKHKISYDICIDDSIKLEDGIDTLSQEYNKCDNEKTALEQKIKEEYTHLKYLKEETDRYKLIVVPAESNLQSCKEQVELQDMEITDLKERKAYLAKMLGEMTTMPLETQKEVFKASVGILQNAAQSLVDNAKYLAEANAKAQQEVSAASCGPDSLASRVEASRLELKQIKMEIDQFSKTLPLQCDETCKDVSWTKCIKYKNSIALCGDTDPGQNVTPLDLTGEWWAIHWKNNSNEWGGNPGGIVKHIVANIDNIEYYISTTPLIQYWKIRQIDDLALDRGWTGEMHSPPDHTVLPGFSILPKPGQPDINLYVYRSNHNLITSMSDVDAISKLPVEFEIRAIGSGTVAEKILFSGKDDGWSFVRRSASLNKWPSFYPTTPFDVTGDWMLNTWLTQSDANGYYKWDWKRPEVMSLPVMHYITFSKLNENLGLGWKGIMRCFKLDDADFSGCSLLPKPGRKNENEYILRYNHLRIGDDATSSDIAKITSVSGRYVRVLGVGKGAVVIQDNPTNYYLRRDGWFAPVKPAQCKNVEAYFFYIVDIHGHNGEYDRLLPESASAYYVCDPAEPTFWNSIHCQGHLKHHKINKRFAVFEYYGIKGYVAKHVHVHTVYPTTLALITRQGGSDAQNVSQNANWVVGSGFYNPPSEQHSMVIYVFNANKLFPVNMKQMKFPWKGTTDPNALI